MIQKKKPSERFLHTKDLHRKPGQVCDPVHPQQLAEHAARGPVEVEDVVVPGQVRAANEVHLGGAASTTIVDRVPRRP